MPRPCPAATIRAPRAGLALLCAGTWLAAAVAAFAPSPLRADDPAPNGFRVTVRVDLGRDEGQAGGTLFEACDADGKPVAGAGFLNAYNTQDRSDRRLVHFYVKTGEKGEFRPEPLPRPSTDAGTYLFGLENKLFALGRADGKDGRLRVWSPESRAWETDDATRPLGIHAGDGILSVAARQVTHGDRTVLELTPDEGLVGEWYLARGYFVFRRRNPSADPPINELRACRYDAQGAEGIAYSAGVPLPLATPGEFVYAYGQLGGKILAATNTGGVYVFDTQSKSWSSLRTPNGVSYQVYAAINYENRLLLGQYPTGELFEFNGAELRHLADQPPRMPHVSPRAREAQTLTIYGGDLYAGVWPWGEVWRLDRRENRWEFLGRMFTHPEPTDATVHPYEEETTRLDPVLNRWGQRVTSLTPLGDSLYISTSAKSSAPYAPKFTFLAGDKWKEYGAVYRFRKSGCLAAPFVWKTEPTTFEFAFDGARLTVSQDGEAVAAADCAERPAGELREVKFGTGVFGPFDGKVVSHQVARRSENSETSSAVARGPRKGYLGAYVDMRRCFDGDAPPAARERSIDETLDRFQKAGLRVIMPYANTSSWSVNYPSEVVDRHVFADWDPLARFAAGARRRGLQVWPAVCVCSSGHFEPRGILLDHPDWAIRDPEGKPLGFISPAHPAARRWIVSALREMVRKYQPDGVLLDYLRYFNRPWQLDEAAQAALDRRLAAEAGGNEEDVRRLEQRLREEHLTELAREISEALRAEKPDLVIGIYTWGPHVASGHRVGQDWKTWVAKGYVDMINVSGYCYPAQYGEKYLEVFESRLRTAVELAAATGRSVPVTFALGIETSHGKVTSAAEIERYLAAAERAGVDGAALFTWNTALPYLDELTRNNAFARFSGGAPR